MDVKNYVTLNENLKFINRDLYELLDLTQTHITISCYVYMSENNKKDLSEMACEMKTNTSVLNRQLKELIKRNYISKQRYENNLRKVYLEMTEEQLNNTKVLLDLIDEFLNETQCSMIY